MYEVLRFFSLGGAYIVLGYQRPWGFHISVGDDFSFPLIGWCLVSSWVPTFVVVAYVRRGCTVSSLNVFHFLSFVGALFRRVCLPSLWLPSIVS